MVNSDTPAPRLNPSSSLFDKWGFFIAVGAGAVCIIALKRLGVAQLIVTVVPVAIMAAYALIVWRSRRFQLREDQSGDNLYYLGFLFTLVSLAYALAVFTPTAGATDIIENFGIALATTIVGLALRVVFNQMRQDPVEIEREARLELAEAASRLRTALDQVVLDMNHFRRATQQSIAEGMDAVAAEASKSMASSAEKFGNVANDLGSRMETMLGGFANNADKLNALASKEVTAIEALLVRVERIEAPSDLITVKLIPVLEAIRDAGEEVKKRAKGDDKAIARLTKAIETALAGADVLAGRVEGLNASGERANMAVDRVSKIAGQSEKLLTDLHGAVADMQLLTREQAAGVAQTKAIIADAGNSLSAMASAWQREAQTVIDGIANKGLDAQRAIVQSLDGITLKEKDALQGVVDALAASVAAIRKHSEELEGELATARRYTRDVHGSLVEMTDQLTQRLGTAPAINRTGA